MGKVKYMAMEIAGDENYEVDPPAAVILRVDDSLYSRVRRSLELMRSDDFESMEIQIRPQEMRWIGMVGFLSDGNLASVKDGETGLDWMPEGADVWASEDLKNIDPDGERADHRDDCAIYDGEDGPIVGGATLCFSKLDKAGARDSNASLQFSVRGHSASWHFATFIHHARDVWPELVTQEDAEQKGYDNGVGSHTKATGMADALRELYPYVLRHDQPGERWPRLLIEEALADANEPLQIQNEKLDTHPGMRELLVNVSPLVDANELDLEDENVAGVYTVYVDQAVSMKVHASVALDTFHSTIAISMLDDFVIDVVDSIDHRVLEEEEDAPHYAIDRHGNFGEKIQPEPFVVAWAVVDGVKPIDGGSQVQMGTAVKMAASSLEDIDELAVIHLWDKARSVAGEHPRPRSWLVDSDPTQPTINQSEAP
ncbi:MAG: hypothetical protein EPN79_11705 [Burkholderiaceae bacterium]|nr:MAG: hypothetical protein EPN79_11705 [Burkholderiaceae bacterium]TBR76678.1 MAG: hypothetical protein EPN64_05360 [Burkholderiaceae bacterium]